MSDSAEGSSFELVSHAYLCGVDPLFHTHVNILIRTLRHMIPIKEFQDPPLYFFCFPPLRQPRPIRLVVVSGIVVHAAIHQKVCYPTMKSFT